MKKPISVVMFLFGLILSISCSSNKAYHSESDKSTVCIGTFNLEWLGDGIGDKKPRSSADYEKYAEIIANSGMEVIGVQEVENSSAIKKIMKYLPDYKYILGKKGSIQNVGLIYKNTIQVESLGEYTPLKVEPERTRPGLIVKCKKGNFDWVIMVVHLKSTSRYDDTPEKRQESFDYRKEQAEVLSNWVDSIVDSDNEHDVFIVGDFNDNPRRDDKVIAPLSYNSNIVFLTWDMQSCKNKMWDMIDHIVISKSVKNRYLDGSVHAYDFFSTLTDKAAEGISDHCPVMAVFDVTAEDND
ncbi:MAG: endonuclease/exonuclease/phosphatase family protein [bacterium]